MAHGLALRERLLGSVTLLFIWALPLMCDIMEQVPLLPPCCREAEEEEQSLHFLLFVCFDQVVKMRLVLLIIVYLLTLGI